MAVYAPIYKDTIWTYDTPFIQYRIESPQGNVILEGRADTRPDGTPPTIYVNRLCEPFLAQELNPVESGLTSQGGATRTFYLYNDLNDALLETYTFLRAYSGDWEGKDKILNDPIRPSISKEMTVPFSIYTASGASLPMLNYEEEVEYTGNTCGYYIHFSAPGLEVDSENNYTLHIGPDPSTIIINVSTNIPYHTFPLGTLFHSHPAAGVWAYYDNTELVLWQYTDVVNGNKGTHTIYDHTDQDPPTIEYRSMTNISGREKTYFETFSVEPPLCNNRRTVIATITIIQSA